MMSNRGHPPNVGGKGPIGATPRMRGPNEGHPRNGALERVSGTCPSESASQRAPTCDCQGEVATSGQVGATPQVATPSCDPNGATRESRARVAPGGPMGAMSMMSNRGHPPNVGGEGPIGATPRMRGPNGGHPRNGTLERVSGTCPSKSASQRAPTCDCQGEVATSGQVGATPQVATPNCDPNGAARESRARAASGRRTGPPPPGANRGHPPNAGAQWGPPPERDPGTCLRHMSVRERQSESANM
jgi:hypothetical protein